MSGLYIHVPFCKQACSYCDFYFVTRQEYKQDYTDLLIQEILSKKNTRFSEETVRTIYFGGGTPSLLSPSQIDSIMNALQKTFDLNLSEVTLEMNPDDVSRDYLSALKQAGITRSSMGVQSFDARLLDFMHRAHTAEEALRCMEILSSSDFEAFTVDLIYGNPGQSLEALEADIEQLLKFDPPHLSAYSLTIEPQTRLGKQVELGRILPPENDLVADHYDLVTQKLEEHQLLQYEVSNFAKKGHEAVHNANYWSHENYLGLGPGAHSFWWNENGGSANRWTNQKDLRAYLNMGWEKPWEEEILELPALAEEHLMLGLRTRKGIDPLKLKERYSYNLSTEQMQYLRKLSSQGKANIGERIYLTREGLRIADTILLDLLTL